MEPKKNRKLDPNRNSLLYFFVGMTMMLLMAFLALEWKTFYSSDEWDRATLKIQDDLIEEVPITMQKLPDPPKPKIITPPKIEIADDDEKIEETVIEAVDPNQDTEIAEIEDIEVAEEEINEEIPIVLVEKAPVFPGCENETTEEDKRQCFQEMMQRHIRKNFHYPENALELGLEGKIAVMFTIEKDGSIGNVRLRGPHKSLEAEAARIISKLPSMTPGKQRGTAVKVSYAIPITFRLN
ncbi:MULTISPECIES: energy transducer TonB [Flagellimonas]|uniref:Energy transducer TonB n=1 Tax=Flagellimonas hadalis TaxID=2597517 RepID=A0A5N5J454_9FLAO|nr:energy transducer TonB [Allomuricauda hadalis]KAB5490020.1 energy transducer TonB [Allomuricauda hadalis]RUA13642.1 MAG: energy transducer TonB [Flavobacteriia bacterium]